MTRTKANEYRRRIESAATLQNDESALESVWMYPEWQTSHAYVVGERIRYNDTLYKCVQAHTSQDDWTPDITSALWVSVSLDEYPEWSQPTGAHDAYMTGDKVSHIGKHWICTFDYNTYEPSVYGWDEVIV